MDVTHSDQAGPDASNSIVPVVMNDETVDNESTNGEQIESDSDDIYVPFSTAQFKHSNAAGKRSIDGR